MTSNAARALAAALGKPLVGVHHMVRSPVFDFHSLSLTYLKQAHAVTVFLSLPEDELPKYPFLSLLISGGHTLLLLARSSTAFSVLATTPDDSIGNAYDKVSRLLSLSWSTLGPGAALEKFCADHPPPLSPAPHDRINSYERRLSFPLSSRGELMFSYSGLYSSVQRYVEALPPEALTSERKAHIAWAFQRAAVGQLEEKLCLGLKWCSRHDIDIRHVVVSGGVASNAYVRER